MVSGVVATCRAGDTSESPSAGRVRVPWANKLIISGSFLAGMWKSDRYIGAKYGKECAKVQQGRLRSENEQVYRDERRMGEKGWVRNTRMSMLYRTHI